MTLGNFNWCEGCRSWEDRRIDDAGTHTCMDWPAERPDTSNFQGTMAELLEAQTAWDKAASEKSEG